MPHARTVFAERHESAMRRVYDTSLQRSAEVLASPEMRHRSITDTAFVCGFNDVSHFGRMFASPKHMARSRGRRRE